MAKYNWECISDKAIRVNLSAPPNLPFQRVTVEWNEGSGWVTVERRGDDLYVVGRKVRLLSVRFLLQQGRRTGEVRSHDLRKRIDITCALHPNILDALLENVHLIPESWKVCSLGRDRYIFFMAVAYGNSCGELYFWCLSFRVDEWRRGLLDRIRLHP